MKKKELIRRSINKLLIAVLLTACFVALLIRLLFSEPARRHVEHTSIALEEPEGESPAPEPARSPEEILDVQLSIADYISRTHEVKHEVRKSLIRLERVIPEKAYPRQVIRLMKNILAGRSDEGV
jgi:hypothetical protein